MFDILGKFKDRKILVVGDLMLDEYLWGNVDRISPEAPVQVVAVRDESYTLGGAGNVINNLTTLGARVIAVGLTGTDAQGALLRERLDQLRVDTRGVVAEANRPTTRKTRIIAANQHVLRIDREVRQPVSNQTIATLKSFLDSTLKSADLVLISDYGKGLLTDTLLAYIILKAGGLKKKVVVDPKGLNFLKYSGATLLTPNRKEAALAAGMEIRDRDRQSIVRAAEKLKKSVDVANLLITCGKDGMALFQNGKPPHYIQAEAKQVFDVSGAGDTVLSVLGLALAADASFEDSAALANMAAGIVVGKLGTAVIHPDEIRQALRGRSGPPTKLVGAETLSDLVHRVRQKGQRIVLTNGCFDLLHSGHIEFLAASKAKGDVLIVAIDDDESVRRIKGGGRPLIPADLRVRVLSAIDSIDHVIVFSSDKLEQLIQVIRPDVLTKGDNFAAEQVSGARLVKNLGGEVVLVPVAGEVSSAQIIDMIKNA